MATLLLATRESDSLRSENPRMSQPSRALVLPAEELPLSSWSEEVSAPHALAIRHRRTGLQSEGELRRSAFLLRSECRKRYAQKAHTSIGWREWRKQVQAD